MMTSCAIDFPIIMHQSSRQITLHPACQRSDKAAILPMTVTSSEFTTVLPTAAERHEEKTIKQNYQPRHFVTTFCDHPGTEDLVLHSRTKQLLEGS